MDPIWTGSRVNGSKVRENIFQFKLVLICNPWLFSARKPNIKLTDYCVEELLRNIDDVSSFFVLIFSQSCQSASFLVEYYF